MMPYPFYDKRALEGSFGFQEGPRPYNFNGTLPGRPGSVLDMLRSGFAKNTRRLADLARRYPAAAGAAGLAGMAGLAGVGYGTAALMDDRVNPYDVNAGYRGWNPYMDKRAQTPFVTAMPTLLGMGAGATIGGLGTAVTNSLRGRDVLDNVALNTLLGTAAGGLAGTGKAMIKYGDDLSRLGDYGDEFMVSGIGLGLGSLIPTTSAIMAAKSLGGNAPWYTPEGFMDRLSAYNGSNPYLNPYMDKRAFGFNRIADMASHKSLNKLIAAREMFAQPSNVAEFNRAVRTEAFKSALTRAAMLATGGGVGYAAVNPFINQ